MPKFPVDQRVIERPCRCHDLRGPQLLDRETEQSERVDQSSSSSATISDDSSTNTERIVELEDLSSDDA